MYDNDYLEKILGEQYNMSDYFEDTYTQPVVNIVDESTSSASNHDVSKPNKDKHEEININTENEIKQNKNSRIKDEDITQQQFTAVQVSSNNIADDIEGNIQEEKAEEETTYNNMYPEIYNAIEPIVELVVSNNLEKKLNNELIENMTNKIYYAVETDSEPDTLHVNESVTHGDVLSVSTRPRNNMLRDLIKILILNNIINNKPQKPLPPPPPPHHHHNNTRPPIPPRPRSMNVSNNISYHDVPYPEDM